MFCITIYVKSKKNGLEYTVFRVCCWEGQAMVDSNKYQLASFPVKSLISQGKALVSLNKTLL